MQVPKFLQELIRTNRDLAAVVDGTLARFEPWLGNSQMPLFPEYTDHSITHVEDVMRTAVDLSTGMARNLLSAKDAAVLVLAVCLHDAAMHLTEDGFFSLVRTDSIWRPVLDFDSQPWNVLWQDFLADARRFDGRKLLALFGDTDPIRHPPDKVTDLTMRDRLLMGEFIRQHHARLAHEIGLYGIPGPDGKSVSLLSRSSESEGWLADIAGVTARSHGIPLRDAVGYLQRNYHVRDFNGVHAVFLMVLLRNADYLQIQAKRAPTEVLDVRKLASPVSQGEWKVHASVRNITRADDDPEAVLIDARPLDVGSYLRVRRWIDGIQDELDKSWAVLGEVYGRYTQEQLNDLGIELRRVRSNLDNVKQFADSVDYVPARVSFEAANTDLLKLLVGPLYGDKPDVGLRELIQNAVDAVSEIDDFLPRRPDLHDVSRIDQEADVKITVRCEREPDFQSLIPSSVTISDRGMGMNQDVIQNYFLKAGASFRRSDAWRQKFEDGAGHSNILRSGRFGVGALAAFLIGDRIEVTSRHVESPPDRGISFTASLDDDAVPLKWISCAVGTTITIQIPPDRREAVAASFSLEGAHRIQEISYYFGLCQYLSREPSVIRILQIADEGSVTLTVDNTVPAESEEASMPWRSFKTDNYSAVFWTYDIDFPYLTCNGIVVSTSKDENLSMQFDTYPDLHTPRVLIYDRNGRLPLNLQRTSLASPDVQLSSALLADVVDDLIAYALVDGPCDMGSLASYRWIKGKYEGFSGRHFMRHSAHRWFVSRSGFGLVDRRLAFAGDASAFLIAYPVGGLESAHRLQLQDYIGHAATHLPNNLRLMFFEGLHYGKINDIKLLARSLLNQYDFRQIVPSCLSDWSIKGHRVFLRRSLMERFQNDMTFGRRLRQIVGDANAETEDEDWIVFRYGQCPALQILHRDSPVLLQAQEASLAAIVECYPSDTQVAESEVAERWMTVLGAPIIPFDEDQRKTLFTDAYDELKPHIDLWRATVAQDRAKTEEDLIEAEENIEADRMINSN